MQNLVRQLCVMQNSGALSDIKGSKQTHKHRSCRYAHRRLLWLV